MPKSRAPKTTRPKAATKADSSKGSGGGFSEAERTAMKERAQEMKQEARRGRTDKGDTESAVLAKIAEMPRADRVLAERVHELIKATAPDLTSRTWYGMPAYARDGKIVCFFQSADKFKARYATLGFTDEAKLDAGALWPVAFALKDLTAAEETKIAALVKKAVR